MPSWAPQLSTLSDSVGNQLTFATTPGGFQLPITPLPDVLFSDLFNGATIDTVYRWQSPVTAAGGTMTQAAGSLVTTLGTTVSAAAAITTIESFEPTIGSMEAGTLLSIEAAPATNTNRCFGFYTRPGSFTAATPVQDGYVWEYDITGTFGASIYSGGTRISRTTVNPVTGVPFFTAGQTFVPLLIAYQGLNVNFYINSFSIPALTVPLAQPSTLNLPFGFHSINHTSGPASAPTWSMSAIAVIDASGCITSVWNGQAYSRNRSPGKFVSLNAVSVAAETTIWTPAAGRKFRLMGYNLTALGAAGNVVLKDNTAGASLPIVLPFGAIGANLSSQYPGMGNGIVSATANNVLTATGAASQTLSGYVFGTEE
jgi:hypothetical protein